jgi:hypothetical protein
LSGIRCWISATSAVAQTLGVMFEELYPDTYHQFRQAFDAGVWIEEDPGPWLGRAIVYKLQVSLHTDKHDIGPTASFGCGSYTGGEMLVPQLGAKFA